MANYTVSTRLIADVGQYVGGMNAAAGATARLGESATKSSAQAASGFGIASKGALLMGGAAVAGLGMAIKSSMDFERSMSAVRAATQASAGTLEELRTAAIKAGKDTQYSATEAANAITEMGKAGVSSKDIMGGGLTGALNLAAAGQLDVADAAGIASTALVQFGLSGKDLPHVADLLAAGSNKALGSVEDLSNALKYVGPVAAGMGVSIEQTTGTLALFASQGILSEQAGTSLRGMLTALTSPSKIAAETMGELGINVFDAQGKFVGLDGVAGELHDSLAGLTEAERSEALGRIFGNEQITAARVLYEGGAKSVEDWTSKVNDSGYAQKQAAQLTDNLNGDLERLGGSFDTLMVSLGSGAQGPLRDLVQMLGGIVDAVTWVVSAFGDLPAPVQVAIVTLGAVAALKGPVASAFETIGLKALYAVESFSGLSMSMGGLKAAGAGLLGVFGGPWGLAITGATVGLSLLVELLGKSDHATSSLATSEQSLTDAIQSSNGALDEHVRRLAAEALQKENLLKFTGLYGVSSRDMVGYVLGEADAHDRVTTALDTYRASLVAKLTGDKDADAVTRGLIGAVDQHKAALDGLASSTTSGVAGQKEIAEAVGQTGGAMAMTTAQTEAANDAQTKWLENLQQMAAGFVDPINAYKGLLADKQQAEQQAAQATADSTANSKDSWRDYVDDVEVSLDELATKLEEQITNQENWRANLITVTQRGGLEVGQILASMGVEGAQITAQMATATAADFERMKNDLITNAHLGGAGAAAELDTQMKVMAAIAASGGQTTVQGLAAQLGIGVDTVASIVQQYNSTLAAGVNPLLTALGKPTIAGYHVAGRNGPGGTQVKNAWSGGYMGDGGKYEPKGIVHGGEFVLTKSQTAKAGVGNLYAYAKSLDGYAGGGFVSSASVPRPRSTAPYTWAIGQPGDATMAKGYDETRAWVDANAMGPGPTGPIGAGVERWRALVLAALNLVHQPGAYADITLRRMNRESGGNLRAINLTDSNAKRGTPSKGLMQVIDPTFRAYAMAGHNTDIWDPMSNVLASMRYAMARYGSLPAAYNKAGGYAAGGTTPAGDPFWVGENGPELMWSSRQKYVSSAARSREVSGGSASFGGGSVSIPPPVVKVYLDGQEWRGMARVEAQGVVVDFANGATNRADYNR